MPDHRPITLAIETSNPAPHQSPHSPEVVSVAVGLGAGSTPADAEWFGGEPLRAQSRHDDALMPAIDRLCRAHSVLPGDLSRIAVSLGPGGFTGLRIAVMTAKLIAEATGAKCVGVPTARALMLALDPRADAGTSGRVGVCLAWKRDDVWRQLFTPAAAGDEWTPIDDGRIVALSDIAADGATSLIADADLARILRERSIDLSGIAIHPPRFDAALVFRASLGLAPTDPVALLPIYPREPEAVTKWRALGRAKNSAPASPERQ